jgi:hypothetical protein
VVAGSWACGAGKSALKNFSEFSEYPELYDIDAYFGTATICLSEFGSGTKIYRAIDKPDPSVPRPGATTLSDATTARGS